MWLGLNRRTREIITYHIGDRTEESYRLFYSKIPNIYKQLSSYSDNWEPYKVVFSYKTLQHACVDKRSGETNYIERFNLTLRQRVSCYVRKTLSFSKSDYWHRIVTPLFIIHYNESIYSP